MKKSIELILNSLLNFSLALIAGGILKIAFENTTALSSFVILASGFYAFLFVCLILLFVDKG